MLDETGFYAPSMAHNALPSRPWLGISGFHGHNSTASKLLRYSRPRECGMPARTLRLSPPYVVDGFNFYVDIQNSNILLCKY